MAGGRGKRCKASLAAYPTADALYLTAHPKHAPRFLSFLMDAHLLERSGKTPLELNFVSLDGLQITPQAGASSAGSQSPVLHLTDESLGVLWQNHTQRLHKILSGLKKEDRGGYLATADPGGRRGLVVALSFAWLAYDPAVTPEAAGQDLYRGHLRQAGCRRPPVGSFYFGRKGQRIDREKNAQAGRASPGHAPSRAGRQAPRRGRGRTAGSRNTRTPTTRSIGHTTVASPPAGNISSTTLSVANSRSTT